MLPGYQGRADVPPVIHYTADESVCKSLDYLLRLGAENAAIKIQEDHWRRVLLEKRRADLKKLPEERKLAEIPDALFMRVHDSDNFARFSRLQRPSPVCSCSLI